MQTLSVLRVHRVVRLAGQWAYTQTRFGVCTEALSGAVKYCVIVISPG